MEFTEEEYRRIGYIAGSLSKQCTFLSKEDLFQEGCLIWMERRDLYDEYREDSNLVAFMNSIVSGYLMRYIKRYEYSLNCGSRVRYLKELQGLEFVVGLNSEEALSMVDEDASLECLRAVVRIDNAEAVRIAMEGLSDRERKVTELYFGLAGNEPLTLEKIGKKYGVSRARVRQILTKAMQHMRRHSSFRVMGSCEDVFCEEL